MCSNYLLFDITKEIGINIAQSVLMNFVTSKILPYVIKFIYILSLKTICMYLLYISVIIFILYFTYKFIKNNESYSSNEDSYLKSKSKLKSKHNKYLDSNNFDIKSTK